MKNMLQRLSPLPLIAFLILFHIIIYFAFRLVLFSFIEPSIIDRDAICEGLYIGLKFDTRYAIFTSLALALALLIPAVERTLYLTPSFTRKIFCAFQSMIFSVFILVHIVDLGVFFYLRQRLDMTLMEFVENPMISAVMVWQSYPVVWISLAFFLVIVGYYVFWNAIIGKQTHVLIRKREKGLPCFKSKDFFIESDRMAVPQGSMSFSMAVFIRVFAIISLFIMGYGQISSNFFPLRWSNAYLSADKNIALIALHPTQNLFDTTHIIDVVDPDMDATRAAFPRMAAYLGTDSQILPQEGDILDFSRHIAAKEREKPLNVVLIMMESLGTNRSSLDHGMASFDEKMDSENSPKDWNINPTPFLAELVKDSLYYPNFFANSRTTARGIFSSLTGIPDINFSGGTSSRNPKVVDQHLLFNEFDTYEKYYLIGGNANWANIRGVFQNNIKGLQLLEEEFWEAPNTDVWGISDLALLRESVGLFNESKKPFIAFVQTAGFHRPYTIPADNEGFELVPDPSPETMSYWGFESAAEYNSLRFADHALKIFFEKAQKEDWFKNTVFVIFGDHGLTNPSENMTAGYNSAGLQAWHVPFVIYAPGKVLPGINPALHSQVDMFPTLAAMAGIEHRNTTLGKNILDELPNGMFVPKEFSLQKDATGQETYVYDYLKDKAQDNRVYIGRHEGYIYLLQNKYVYYMNVDDHSKERVLFYDMTAKPDLSQLGAGNAQETFAPENLVDTLPGLADDMHKKTLDFYHTAKYLLQNNKKRN